MGFRHVAMVIGSFDAAASLRAQAVVRPQEIDDVVINPGIGVMTFQRLNEEALNEGLRWDGTPNPSIRRRLERKVFFIYSLSGIVS